MMWLMSDARAVIFVVMVVPPNCEMASGKWMTLFKRWRPRSFGSNWPS
jgi:hypothetical protein